MTPKTKLAIFQKEVEKYLTQYKKIFQGLEHKLKAHQRVNMSLRAVIPMILDCLENSKDWQKDVTFEDDAIINGFIQFLWGLSKQKMGKYAKEQALWELNQIKKVLHGHGIKQ